MKKRFKQETTRKHITKTEYKEYGWAASLS